MILKREFIEARGGQNTTRSRGLCDVGGKTVTEKTK